MSRNQLMAEVEETSLRKDKFDFDIGDTVDVHCRILEGDKQRIQIFNGIVIARRGHGTGAMFTVRRIVNGEGVERVFPVNSPKIAEVEVKRKAVVRRAKLYYLRDRIGKAATKLKERPMVSKEGKKGRVRTRVKKRKEKVAAGEETKASKRSKRKQAKADKVES